jgi:hypothetical protein
MERIRTIISLLESWNNAFLKNEREFVWDNINEIVKKHSCCSSESLDSILQQKLLCKFELFLYCGSFKDLSYNTQRMVSPLVTQPDPYEPWF